MKCGDKMLAEESPEAGEDGDHEIRDFSGALVLENGNETKILSTSRGQ